MRVALFIIYYSLNISFQGLCQPKDNKALGQDSLFINDSSELFIELKTRLAQDQRARKVISSKRRNQEIKDLSTTNTIRLVEIVSKYGYPTLYRFDTTAINKVAVWVLFDHADLSYADTLKSLLLNEFELSRISESDYGLISWHLNGRIGIPDMQPGIKIKKSRRARMRAGNAE